MANALDVKLALGPQLNQPNAHLVLLVLVLLLTQTLLMLVLPVLVRMLDATHVLVVVLHHAHHVMQVML